LALDWLNLGFFTLYFLAFTFACCIPIHEEKICCPWYKCALVFELPVLFAFITNRPELCSYVGHILLDPIRLWRDFVQLGLDTRAVKRTERVLPFAACALLAF
jgi:hypothetical protein